MIDPAVKLRGWFILIFLMWVLPLGNPSFDDDVAPPAGTWILSRFDRSCAGRTPNAGIALVMERVDRNLVLPIEGIHFFVGPIRKRINLVGTNPVID